MKSQPARALTYQALIELKTALDSAESPDDFFAEADAIIIKPQNVLDLPFDSGSPEPLNAGSSGESGRDADNAPLIYEFLGALDRANASDRRLWTYLAFSTFRDYMEARWPLGESRRWKGRVQDRWLMLNATRGKLVRHGIARLWWIAAMTHDPKREHSLSKRSQDAFVYTRAVLRNEDRVIGLFDREAGALPALVRSVLEHSTQHPAHGKDSHIRGLMKELTLAYGYRDLSVLDATTLDNLVSELAPQAEQTIQR